MTPERIAARGPALVAHPTAGHGHTAEAYPLGPSPRPELPTTTRLNQVFERTVDASPEAVALECQGTALTYRALDDRANALANLLLAGTVTPGSRIGILLGRSVEMYVALLAALKTSSTFVPVDPAVPVDRLAFVAEDSELDLVLTDSALSPVCVAAEVPFLAVDALAAEIAQAPKARPAIVASGDPTCYVIYTSGSTGRPKGVEIAHSSICNFLDVVPTIYDVKPSDRVYQGMTISFDFSIEEIWPTWAVGATLVAGPTDGRRVGAGLADFLESAAITMIYCVPTVLATLDRIIPSIRTVNVGGEACPPELVERWGGSGRRILNTYGPTEATVTCTWAELVPGRPVTIGHALPTYTISLLDEQRRPVPRGAVGEICVGGPGVARGYVKRPDLTADRFIPDPADPDGGTRIYRTGDLGRLLPNGELEYLGRADSEVKVRGHRVDLQEIENVLIEEPSVAAAVVRLIKDPATGGDLCGYLLPAPGAPAHGDLVKRVHAAARRQLPPYMVPSFLEVVDAIPMLPSGKADRGALPDPVGPRLVGGDHAYVAPDGATEEQVAGVWQDALRMPEGTLSVEANLFDDLGGHSLIAATVISRLRTAYEAAGLSVLDIYANPTIRTLARHIDERLLDRALQEEAPASSAARPAPPPWWRVATFALAQLMWVFGIVFVFLLPIGVVYSINDGEPSATMLRQLILSFPFSYLIGRWVVPLLGIRLLSIGLTAGEHPLWGWTHLRVWAAQKAVTLSPLNRLAGSPWAETYLRMAGATIGEACHIGTGHIPLPRFVRLGDDATIGYAAHLDPAEIAGGRLTLGVIDVGPRVYVGANSVLQGPCSVGAGALLREQSLLRAGQHIPEGQTWAGSPAEPQHTTGDAILDLMADCPLAPREWPRPLLGFFALGLLVLEMLPLLAVAPVVVAVWASLLAWGELAALAVTVASGPVFVLTACALILLSRRFALVETPVGIHHVRSQLGVEKWFGDKLLEISLELTNSMYATLYTSIWLRMLGAKVGRRAEVSTIANIDPDILTLEDESFIADMASLGSATYCNGHVAFRPTQVGRRAFVGNASFIPSGSHLGDGSLIGVQSVPPVSGVPAGTSWLGAPPIFLPRRETYDEFTEGETFQPSRRKVVNRYVIELFRSVLPASILGTSTFGTLWALSYVAQTFPHWVVMLAAPALALLASLLVVLVVVAIKWCVVGRYRPRVEPLWSGFVRRTEFVTGIYEGAAVPVLLATVSGTPMLAPLLRLFGVHVGRRTLVDTTYLTEFDLVSIGDDVAVGPEASLQTHLFEDRVMKMGTISLQPGSSVGTRAVVLYGSAVGDDAVLAPLSLVMKGESLPAGTGWAGIPAQPAPRSLAPTAPAPTGTSTTDASPSPTEGTL